MPSPVRPSRNRNPAPRAMPLKLARFWLICLFFLVWAILIALRLFWLQVVRHKEYVERAEKQQQRTFEVAPRRGVLYDRNLHELAMTVQVDSIFAVPSEMATSRRPLTPWPRLSTPTPTTPRPPRSRLPPV
jgi:cell division protein FtsI (penicillin-binding protein 3)